MAELRERQTQELANLRRQEILDAACRLFADRGYHATGIADIARELGIGHGTVYRYFKNKHAILDQVMDGLATRIVQDLISRFPATAATSPEEFRAQAERLIAALWEVHDADPPAMRFVVLQGRGVDAELTERFDEFAGLVSTSVGTYLAQGVERGFLRSDLDTRVVGEVVFAAIGAILVRGDYERTAREAFTHAAIDVLFRGLEPRAGSPPAS